MFRGNRSAERLRVLASHMSLDDTQALCPQPLTFSLSATAAEPVRMEKFEDEDLEDLEVEIVYDNTKNKWTMTPITKQLTFDQGLFQAASAIQQLKLKDENRVILVGVSGPPGAGKSTVAMKLANMFEGVVIPLESFVKIQDGVEANFDDVFCYDFEMLKDTLTKLQAGQPVEIPQVSPSKKQRVGTYNVSVPSGRIVIVDGSYALNSAIRDVFDLTIAINGGVHMDLLKRIFRDLARSRTPKKEAILDITHVLFPMYKVYIEPDMNSAMIKITSNFNPMLDINDPIYVCKAKSKHVKDFDRVVRDLSERTGYSKPVSPKNFQDIYLYPPAYDPHSPMSSDRTNWIRIRSSEGLWYIQFYNEIIDPAVNVRPTLNFEISVRTLSGLLSLGYQIGATMHRTTEVLYDKDNVQITKETIKELKKTYIQIKSKDRHSALEIAQKLGLSAHHIPQSFLYLYFRKLKKTASTDKPKKRE